jgi:hypothetical protein
MVADNIVSIEAHERLGGPQTISVIGRLNRERQTADERAANAEGWRNHWKAKAAIAERSATYWRTENREVWAILHNTRAALGLLAILLLALALVRMGW